MYKIFRIEGKFLEWGRKGEKGWLNRLLLPSLGANTAVLLPASANLSSE